MSIQALRVFLPFQLLVAFGAALTGCSADTSHVLPGAPDDAPGRGEADDEPNPVSENTGLPTLYDSGSVVLRGQCTAGCAEGKSRCETKASDDFLDCDSGCFENPYDTYCNCCYCLNVLESTERSCDNRCAQTNSCGESEFEVDITMADSALEEACLDASARHRCWSVTNEFGVEYDGVDFCPQFALVEAPSWASFYECVVTDGCDADCPIPAPDVEGTEQACAELAACGQGCTAEQERFLLQNLGWLRPDVRGALDTCLSLSCGEGRVHCFRAWAGAVVHHIYQPAAY